MRVIVPKLRFKEFNNDYTEFKLKDIVNFYKGNTLSKSDIIENGDIKCILYGELYTKYSEIAYKIYSRTNNFSNTLFWGQTNDVLIPCSGETALDISTSTCLQENNIAIGGDLNILRPLNSDGKYLSYLICNKKRREIAKYAQGDSIVHLYGEKIKNITIYLPTINEQEKISKMLSLLDKKIELQKQKIEVLKLYKKGLLLKIFYNKNKNMILGKILKMGKAGGTPKTTNQEYYKGNIPFLSIKDMTEQGKYIVRTEKKISKKGLESSSTWIVPINALILSMYASYGVVALSKIRLATSQAMFSMIFADNINIEYMYYYLSYLREVHYYDTMISQGTQANLNADKIRKMLIYLPSDEEQYKISNLFVVIDKKVNIEEEKVEKMINIKGELLQQMFI